MLTSGGEKSIRTELAPLRVRTRYYYKYYYDYKIMPSGPVHKAIHDNAALFDAPRPAVTNRLGKKRTEELIQADGDTWQEYLAVCEKPETKPANAAPRLSFFGKLNKKKSGKSASASAANNNNGGNSGNSGKGVNLTIRSYFQNQRTGKKVWDEPPSGASNIVPASEEMRRMADIQLSELYVATSKNAASCTGIGGSGAETTGRDDRKTKKSVSGGLFQRGNHLGGSRTDVNTNSHSNSSGDSKPKGPMDREACSSASGKSDRRIRYKPGSALADAAARGRDANGQRRGSTFSDRQLQQAIALSFAENQGGRSDRDRNRNRRADSEDEILRRVLEESRREAMAASTSTSTSKSASRSKSPRTTNSKPVEREVVKRASRKSTKSSTSTTSASSSSFRKHPPPPAVITTTKTAASELFDPYGQDREPSPMHKQDRRQQALLPDAPLPSASRRQPSGSERSRPSSRSNSKTKLPDQAGFV
eukprot:jgi/Psemu1/289290/fgenesh1_pg.342_\